MSFIFIRNFSECERKKEEGKRVLLQRFLYFAFYYIAEHHIIMAFFGIIPKAIDRQ